MLKCFPFTYIFNENWAVGCPRLDARGRRTVRTPPSARHWLSAFEWAVSRDFAFVSAVEISSLRLRFYILDLWITVMRLWGLNLCPHKYFAPAYLVELCAPSHWELEAPIPSLQLNQIFSMFLLLAPPPGRNVLSQWLAPQFGMPSLFI